MKRRNNNVVRVDAVLEANFRHCDLTQSEVFRKHLKRLGSEDRLILLNTNRTQMRVMENPAKFEDGLLEGKQGTGIFKVLSSYSHRALDGGKWTAIQIKHFFERQGFMLVNYTSVAKYFGTYDQIEAEEPRAPTKAKAHSTRAEA